MKVALTLTPKLQGAQPGEPFATVEMPERPLPQEVFIMDGIAYAVLGRAMTIRTREPMEVPVGMMGQTRLVQSHEVEYGLLVREVGRTVDKPKDASGLILHPNPSLKVT